MHGEHSRKTCDLDEAPHAARATDEVQRAAVRAKLLGTADQHAERSGIDEGHRREIDDDLVGALGDALQEHLVEPGGGVEIDLADNRRYGETVPRSCQLGAKLRSVVHELPLGVFGDPRRPLRPA